MANLKVNIEQVVGEKEATLIIKFTNDVPQESIIQSMKSMFEIEMYSAKIVIDKKDTTISLVTTNKEKLELVKKGMMRTFRNASGLGQISFN